jgi:hypothetical protein
MMNIMRVLAGLLFALVMATIAVAQVQVEPASPLPAWCGGSYSITGGLEAQQYADAMKAEQLLPSGTNFVVCDGVVKQVRAFDGKLREVNIPTYPAVPASQVVFEGDGRVLHYTGETDKDGKPIVQQLKLPAIPR